MRRAIEACGAAAALLALGWAAAAPAQSETKSGTYTPPGERLIVTPTGVDMRSGRYTYSATDVSIGEDNETGGLALTRGGDAGLLGHVNPFANFSHNWDIMITVRPIDIDAGEFDDAPAGPDARASVRFGGRSETFDKRLEHNQFSQASNNSMTRLTYTGTFSGSTVLTYAATDGTTATFRPIGGGDCSSYWACAYVSRIEHPDGTRFDFEYDGSGPARLRAVVSNRGYALHLQYGSGADANHVISACVINLAAQARPTNHSCPTSPQGATSYSYTTFESKRRLASATDAGGGVWSFTYARVSGTLRMGFLRPGDTSAWLVNTLTERANNDGVTEELVDSQAFVDGTSWTYYRTLAPQVEGEIPQVAGGSYTDAAGGGTEIEFGFIAMPRGNTIVPLNVGDIVWQVTPGPIRVTDPLGRTTTSTFCDPQIAALPPPNGGCLVTVLQTSTDAEGAVTELSYDGYATRNITRVRRNARPGSNLPDIDTHATYSCGVPVNCARPATTTDANGNVTDYTWDTTHGGLLTETLPAAASGGVRPQTRHAYAQRYAWISNGSGGYVQAATPVWVRTSTSSCRTTAASGAGCAGGTADEVLTQYDYGPNSGPNNLLLRGMTVTAHDGNGLVTLRTCYGYDARGRRISETTPNANLTSCP